MEEKESLIAVAELQRKEVEQFLKENIHLTSGDYVVLKQRYVEAIKELFKDKKEENGRPQAIFVFGVPGAGKSSTLIRNIGKDNYPVINADNFRHILVDYLAETYPKQYNALCQFYIQTGFLNYALITDAMGHPQLMQEAMKEIVPQLHSSFVYEGTARHVEQYKAMMQQLKDNGYEATIYAVWKNPLRSYNATITRFTTELAELKKHTLIFSTETTPRILKNFQAYTKGKNFPRYTDYASFWEAMDNFANNIQELQRMGKVIWNKDIVQHIFAIGNTMLQLGNMRITEAGARELWKKNIKLDADTEKAYCRKNTRMLTVLSHMIGGNNKYIVQFLKDVQRNMKETLLEEIAKEHTQHVYDTAAEDILRATTDAQAIKAVRKKYKEIPEIKAICDIILQEPTLNNVLICIYYLKERKRYNNSEVMEDASRTKLR